MKREITRGGGVERGSGRTDGRAERNERACVRDERTRLTGS